MKTQQLLIQKGNIVDIAIDYGDGYILHVNNNSGLIFLYKIENGKKKLVQNTFLQDKKETTEIVPLE
jgi:hypothetical protein